MLVKLSEESKEIIVTSPAGVRICEASARLENDWREVYATAFPMNEREPEEKLQELIDTGRLLYHKTVGAEGELLCFSLVSLASKFSFLAYIATDPRQRSGGYGSKHMRALIDLLKQDYPHHVGLLLEIESTNPRMLQISGEELNVRCRRLSFYQKLGSEFFCPGMRYLSPSLQGEAAEHELEVLLFNFSDAPILHDCKSGIVAEIYERFYALAADHPLVASVMKSLHSCGLNDRGGK